ncbi:MAG: diaminopimelate dehydrogenase [Clostridia bacterium]|nr:diaminopimelate dehydrogenase [Clostridia bacterium]
MIEVAIYGYGNLGKGVEVALQKANDMNLVGIFTRRNPESLQALTGAKVYSVNDLNEFIGKIDVLIICGGSATDLPEMTPSLARNFNVVDSFDTHAKIPEHFSNVDKVAKEFNHVAIISSGWDPGMFSINRVYSEAILPNGKTYTFWGRGVSQGHSDAIRRIDGVLDAKQYTVPIEEALEKVRLGLEPELSTREKHLRECFVVAKEGADLDKIESDIKNMPNYFKDYDTTVTFISKEELIKNHSGIPHGGRVIRTGKTGVNNENNNVIEYSLKLDSNPEFTASVLVSSARAVYKIYNRKDYGAKTVLDIAPSDLSEKSPEQLMAELL